MYFPFTMSKTPSTAFQRAIHILGSQQAAAAVCGVTQQYVSTVSRGLRRSGLVPAEWCRPIEEATTAAGEPVTRSELRPDLFQAPGPRARDHAGGNRQPRKRAQKVGP